MERFGQQVLIRRGPILALFAVLSIVAIIFASQFRLTADTDRWQPSKGEFANTLIRFAPVLAGSNRLLVALELPQGQIWNEEFFSTYKQLTEDVTSLPGINPRSVQSLWLTNVRYIRMLEDRLGTAPIIPGDLTDDAMTPERLSETKKNLMAPGFGRRFVSQDFDGALIEAEFERSDAANWTIEDASQYAAALTRLREAYASDHTRLHLVAPWEDMGILASQLEEAGIFALVSFVVFALGILLWTRSFLLTLMGLASSLAGLLWQLGAMRYLRLTLDPATLYMLAPILLIALAWSMVQISHFGTAITNGASAFRAARTSLVEGLRPGLLVGAVDLLGLASLSFVPIPAIRDMAIGAAIGMGTMTLANLFLLPLLLAYCPEDEKFGSRIGKAKAAQANFARWLARLGEPRRARLAMLITVPLALMAVIGFVSPSSILPQNVSLHASSIQHQDAENLAAKFPLSANLFAIAIEAPAGACTDYEPLHYLEGLSWYLSNVPGVANVSSLAEGVKLTSALWNEGNLKWKDLPRNKFTLIQSVQPIPLSSKLLNQDCSVLPLRLNLTDRKLDTLVRVSEEAAKYRSAHPLPSGMSMHLAMGEMGERAGSLLALLAVSNKAVGLFLMIIISMLAMFYRDWRALLAVTLPLLLMLLLLRLVIATLQPENSVATFAVPVFVLAMGAFVTLLLYAQIRKGLRSGQNATEAYKHAIAETGVPLFFASLGFILVHAVWIFSQASLQYELGILYGAGVFLNATGAFILMPALAVLLEISFPRRVSFS